jgi:predicted enzyme involved in methoxymalonyl-ACP biosynthesis
MKSLGYKELILRKEIMYETDFRKLKKKEKKLEDEVKKGQQDKTGPLESIKAEIASASAAFKSGEVKLKIKERSFENVERACALNELILRWIDIMEESKPNKKKYFYRPVAAFKTRHLSAAK